MASSRPAPRAEPAATEPAAARPYGLQQVYEKLGGVEYGALTAILAGQVPIEAEALCMHVKAERWEAAQHLAHKVKGSMLALGLDCAADVVALDATLKRVVGGDGGAEAARVQCASFRIAASALVTFLKSERAE